MEYDYLMNISSAIFFICYVPELYANYKNQNANVYNMPEKVLMLIGSGFALSFAVMKDDIALISNYGPIVALDLIALLMRLYYVLRNNAAPVTLPSETPTPPSESSTPPPSEVYID
jgi:hypothetical protein